MASPHSYGEPIGYSIDCFYTIRGKYDAIGGSSDIISRFYTLLRYFGVKSSSSSSLSELCYRPILYPLIICSVNLREALSCFSSFCLLF